MFLTMMKSKIHRATVTEANLNYVGSITIDEFLMEQANILANEKVQVVNITNGNRFETYVIPGQKSSGTVCINGAAARLVQPGDMVIIISYALMNESDAKEYKPRILFVDEDNKIAGSTTQEKNPEC